MRTRSRMDNFAVFILTHGRPNNVKTHKTLRKQGYNGKIVLILDDQDKSSEEYKRNYPDCEFYIFNKKEAIEQTDSADNTGNPKAVVYARNMCHRIASELGLEFFLELDDDYSTFMFTSDKNDNWTRPEIKNINQVFSIFIEFLKSTPIDTVCFAQGGDFIGGKESDHGSNIKLSRKAMNAFFCKTDRVFQFYGLINEDVNMYVLNGSRGRLCFTSSMVQVNQVMTQQNSGGLTTIYLELGTYVKSFYSVMFHPSSVTIKEMGSSHKRLHHSIKADLTYPKIISQKHKRAS